MYGDMSEPRVLPHVDGYVVGFPCQPFSRQNSSATKGWAHASAGVADHMLATTMATKPIWAVFENVMGCKSYFKTLFSKFDKAGLTKAYFVVVCPICPKRTLGIPHSRPRLFFLAVRKDMAVAPDLPSLTDMYLSLLQTVKSHKGEIDLTSLLPTAGKPTSQPSSSPAEEAGPDDTGRVADKRGQKWMELHEKTRQQRQLQRRHLAVPGLSARENDSLDIVLQGHATPSSSGSSPSLVVDVSQRLDRIPVGVNSCPTMTRSSKLVLVDHAGARLLDGATKLELLGIPTAACVLPKKQHMLHQLAGNAMHVDSVGLAMLLAMCGVEWGRAGKKVSASPRCESIDPPATLLWNKQDGSLCLANGGRSKIRKPRQQKKKTPSQVKDKAVAKARKIASRKMCKVLAMKSSSSSLSKSRKPSPPSSQTRGPARASASKKRPAAALKNTRTGPPERKAIQHGASAKKGKKKLSELFG
jgi:site-specific DNA-cytosine methylase